jgi:hypothetical protein
VPGPQTVKTELATHILYADDNTEKLELLYGVLQWNGVPLKKLNDVEWNMYLIAVHLKLNFRFECGQFF